MDPSDPAYNPELPPGFLEAGENYPDFVEDSVEEIWDQLNDWSEFEKGLPKVKAKVIRSAWLECMQASEKSVAEFRARILKAVHDRELPYLKNLIKAMELPRQPEEPINAVRAAIDAFDELFCCEGFETKEEWPTKQMVRRRAEEILKEAGHPPITERHWPRVFKLAGLSALPAGGYNRPV